MTSIPGTGLPKIGVSDKFEHFFAYLLLALLGGLTFHFQKKIGILRRNVFVFCFVIFTAYGLIDEVHQYFIPGRFFDWFDLLANVFGITAGIFILKQLLPSYRNDNDK